VHRRDVYAPPFHELWVLLGKHARETAHFRLRLVRRHTSGKACDDEKVMAAPLVRVQLVVRERTPDLRTRVRKLEAGGHHAHDRVWPAVEHNPLPDNIACTAETLPP
jgi:hypothetical protein